MDEEKRGLEEVVKYKENIAAGIILGIFIFLSSCAPTRYFPYEGQRQWTPVPGGQTSGVKIFVDEQSRQNLSKNVVRLQVRYLYSNPKSFDSGYIKELVVYSQYDCSNKETYKILWSEAHFMDGRNKRDSSERLGHILPDDALFRYICEY